jgi:hypothetical protein
LGELGRVIKKKTLLMSGCKSLIDSNIKRILIYRNISIHSDCLAKYQIGIGILIQAAAIDYESNCPVKLNFHNSRDRFLGKISCTINIIPLSSVYKLNP